MHQRRNNLEEWLADQSIGGELADQYVRTTQRLSEAVAGSGTHGVRTYVTTGSAFKYRSADRLENDVEFYELVACTKLPKYVWVVELVDREARARRDGTPFVDGTILLDASMVEDSADPERWARSCSFKSQVK